MAKVTSKKPKNIIFELIPKQIGCKVFEAIIQPPQILPKQRGILKSLYKNLFLSLQNAIGNVDLIKAKSRTE